MNNPKIQKLIDAAENLMLSSQDPIHDIGHARRVVRNAKILSRDLKLNTKQKDILTLTSWWHDVSRTINNRPSFIWMTCFDDFISALMLIREMFRSRIFTKTAIGTVCLLLCKSLAGGSLLTRILLRKKDRILVDVAHDADNLDVINLERVKTVFKMVDSSKIYSFAYRIMIQWYTRSDQLYMKTSAARKYVEDIIRQFINWLKQKSVIFWHIKTFGERWVKKNLKKLESLLKKITLNNLEVSGVG